MEAQKRWSEELIRIASAEPERLEALKADPLPELKKLTVEAGMAVGPYIPDTLIYRMVVGALGLVVLIAAVGAIILVMAGKTTPDVLIALGSAAVGALAGLLAPSPTGK